MSDAEKGAPTLGASPLQIIVKGGTTSSSYDKELHEQRRTAEAGRAHQDKQQAASDQGSVFTKEGFVSSHLASLRMMDNGNPRLVLYYLNRDKTVRQECVAEIVMLAGGDSLFTMMCPKCFERGVPAGSAQVMVKHSHRKFFIDQRKLGTVVQLADPEGGMFHVRICGTVTCDDILRCSNVGCTWAVKVDDSKVVEV